MLVNIFTVIFHCDSCIWRKVRFVVCNAETTRTALPLPQRKATTFPSKLICSRERESILEAFSTNIFIKKKNGR